MPASAPHSARLRRFRPLPVAALVLAAVAYPVGTRLRYARRFETAVRAERDRDFATATRELAACRQYWPDDPEVRLLAARLGWRARLEEPLPADGWDGPLRDHLRVAETDPRLIDRVTLEEELIDALSGRLARVEAALVRRVKDGHPDAVAILEGLTWANIITHQFPAAERSAVALLAQSPDHPAGHFWRGLIRDLTHGAVGPAAPEYRRAVELAPGTVQYRLRLAQALTRSPDSKPEARGLFEGLTADRPDDPDVWLGLGQCQADLGDPSAARASLQTAARLRPGRGDVLAELGRATLESGDPAAAEPVLRRAVALAPNSRVANYALGTCLGRLGRDAEAKPYLDAATRIYADTQRVHELSRELYLDPAAGPARRCELGELLLRTGHDALGRYWLQSALIAEPGYGPAVKALAAATPGRR